MAGQDDDTERSEDPTQKRLDEALERGDVVKSQEVNTWFIISAATLILMSFSGAMSSGLTTTMRGLIANFYAIRVDGHGFLQMVSASRRAGRGRPGPAPRPGHRAAPCAHEPARGGRDSRSSSRGGNHPQMTTTAR